MTVTSKILADSISETGKRLTTFELRYPRFIHAEIMTHGMLTKNASSSRAIPVKKMIEEIRRDPALPEKWVMNEPGMQGYTEATPEQIETLQGIYLAGLEDAIGFAEDMIKVGGHKQHINRLLEPWMHIRVVLTGTEFANFFNLRAHHAAEPTFQVLAYQMQDLYNTNTPKLLDRGNWHLPYIDEEDLIVIAEYFGSQPDRVKTQWEAAKISAARCARVSYNFEGRRSTVEEDLQLWNKLMGSAPLHASPAGHQGMPDWKMKEGPFMWRWANEDKHGNLIGWQQLRQFYDDQFSMMHTHWYSQAPHINLD